MIQHPFAVLLATLDRAAEDMICICHKTDDGPMGYEWVTAGEASSVVERYAGREHVWFGVQPMNRPEGRGRGTQRDVRALRTLYCDLDFLVEGKPGGMDPVTAMDIIDDLSAILGDRPAAVVQSGYGLQPYWPLDAEVDVIDGALLLARWRALVIDVAARRGAKVDTGVYDLPRILRVPGPPNIKYGKSAPTHLKLNQDAERPTPPEVEAALDAHVPLTENLRVAHAGNVARRAGQAPDNGHIGDRVFTDAEAMEFIEEFALRRARETGWAAGADYWKVIWEAAMTLSNFTEMFEEDDLKDMLRKAVADGHDGVGTDTADEYQIAMGFLKGREWLARRPNENDEADAFGHHYAGPVQLAEGPIEGAEDFVWADAAGVVVDAPASTVAQSGPGVCPFTGAILGAVPRPRSSMDGTTAGDDGAANGSDGAGQTGVSGGRRMLVARRASSIKPESSDWLWEHSGEQWIPLGGLVLLGGREGVGKSTWTARLVAQLTNGKMHGEFLGRPKSVIISATEDAWPQTIIPRLMAAGADLDRVIRVDAVVDSTATGLSLPHDVAALRKLIEEEDVVMVVLDPLLSTIGGGGDKLDTHKDADVRKALEPISLLASETRATFLGLIHQNKSQGGDLLTRLMGSRAFSAVARAVLVCAEADRELEGGEFDLMAPAEPAGPRPPRSFLLGQLKNNLGARIETSVRYEIEGVVVGVDEQTGKPLRTSKIANCKYGDEEGVEESVLAKERAAGKATDGRRKPEGEKVHEKCVEFVAAMLRDNGPTLSKELKEAAEKAGYRDSAFRKAMAALELKRSGDYHNPVFELVEPSGDHPAG